MIEPIIVPKSEATAKAAGIIIAFSSFGTNLRSIVLHGSIVEAFARLQRARCANLAGASLATAACCRHLPN